jgi:GntR family transcriptional regulator/MocR family aminotransferase
MLTYDMNNRGKISAYKYIYHCIKEDILQGNLVANEKLPSKRNFAQHLGVSVVTVMSAYDLLTAEGFIYTLPKKGYYVVPIKTQKKTKLSPIEPEIKSENKIDFDFSGHSVNSSKFPFSVWSRLTRKVLLDYENQLLNPLPYNGAKILREAICKYLYHNCGMEVFPEQIIIGAGTEYLYSLILQILGKDKVYAVENPGYNKIPQIYKMNNVKTQYVDVDLKGLSVEKLRESGASVVHISPSHHYPTGVVMPVDRRHEVLNWADEENGYIIEDDYDSEFRNYGTMESLFSTDRNERVIYLNTFSKSLSPSIRISYLILPPHLLKQYREKMNFLSCTVSSFEQYTLATFINEGYFERHITGMKKYYRELEKTVKEFLQSGAIKNKIEILENKSGLHFLMKIDTEKSDAVLKEKMVEKGIDGKFLSQYLYQPKENMEHFLIVNYSTFNMESLEKAVNILADII